MAFNARKWQKAAFKTVDKCSVNGVCDVIPVNACVGSGKTSVACYAFGKFISEHADHKTVQVFVTPRIRLCDQQAKEIAQFIEGEFGLKLDVDFSIISVDCTKGCYNKKSDTLISKHTIFVICSESLWGIDKKNVDPNCRWHQWIHKFETWKNAGYLFGYAAFDEAHNFENKLANMIGEPGSDDLCIMDFFNFMPMSGTPAAYQRDLTVKYRKNECSCPPKVAMESKWICKPNLNLVMGNASALPAAIKAVLDREIKICNNEVFMPRIMINCSGIDDINSLNGVDWFREHVGKDFHFITLHSDKPFENESGEVSVAEPTVDGVKVSADEAYRAIELIDANGYFNDCLPILVAQVAMLSEGINVNSFNAIITLSNADRPAMQQIGRCIRNYRKDGKDKVNDGHANVYVLTDNVQSILCLLKNLEEYDLTEECYSWGDRFDTGTGAGVEGNEDGIAKLHDMAWEPIDPNNDLEIVEIMGKFNEKTYSNKNGVLYKEFCDGNVNDNGIDVMDELDTLLDEIKRSGMLKIWSNKSFSRTESEKARAVFARAEKLKSEGKKEEAKSVKKEAKTIPSFDIYMSWVLAINNALRESVNRRLWQISPKLAITRVIGSARIAEFVENHLGKKMHARLDRTCARFART